MSRFLRRLWPLFLVILVAGCVLVVILVADRHREGEVYVTWNYSRIEDGLYLGGIIAAPPPGTRAVLNVCETKDPYQAEIHRWEPIPDMGPAPSIDWLRQQVAFIDEQRQAKRTLFVHCRLGANRSVTVVAAYLMWRDGCTRDEALATLHARRSLVGPNAVYLKLLLEWEQSLKEARDAAQEPFAATGNNCGLAI